MTACPAGEHSKPGKRVYATAQEEMEAELEAAMAADAEAVTNQGSPRAAGPQSPAKSPGHKLHLPGVASQEGSGAGFMAEAEGFQVSLLE